MSVLQMQLKVEIFLEEWSMGLVMAREANKLPSGIEFKPAWAGR